MNRESAAILIGCLLCSLSASHPACSQIIAQGNEQSWKWKCSDVTSVEVICNIIPESNRGIAVRISGGASLRGPDTRPIEFLLDLSGTQIRVDDLATYESWRFYPKTASLIKEMIKGNEINITPNGKYSAGLDKFSIKLAGFKEAYCAALKYIKRHSSSMKAFNGASPPPGVDDGVCPG